MNHEIFYFTDDGDLAALRYNQWKAVFMEQRVQRVPCRFESEPFVTLRLPKLFNLRMDPCNADITSNTYYDWLLDHAYMFVPAQNVRWQILRDVC